MSLVLRAIRDVYTQATRKTMEIKNGSNLIVRAIKTCMSVIIVDYSQDVLLQGFRNIKTAASIIRIDILN